MSAVEPRPRQARDEALGDPCSQAFAITAGEDELPYITRALYVGAAGDVAVMMAHGGEVTFKSVPAGTILPIRVKKVTSGTEIIGLY